MKAAFRLALLVALFAFAGLAEAKTCNFGRPHCPQFSCPPADDPDAKSCSTYSCGTWSSDDDYHYNDDDPYDDDRYYNDDDRYYNDDDYSDCDVSCCDPTTKNLVTIIVGAAVGAFVLLVLLPVCYCFWAGVACCAACRGRRGGVTVHQQVAYRPVQNQMAQPQAQNPHPYLNSANPPRGYAPQYPPQHPPQQAPPPYMGGTQYKR